MPAAGASAHRQDAGAITARAWIATAIVTNITMLTERSFMLFWTCLTSCAL